MEIDFFLYFLIFSLEHGKIIHFLYIMKKECFEFTNRSNNAKEKKTQQQTRYHIINCNKEGKKEKVFKRDMIHYTRYISGKEVECRLQKRMVKVNVFTYSV